MLEVTKFSAISPSIDETFEIRQIFLTVWLVFRGESNSTEFAILVFGSSCNSLFIGFFLIPLPVFLFNDIAKAGLSRNETGENETKQDRIA